MSTSPPQNAIEQRERDKGPAWRVFSTTTCDQVGVIAPPTDPGKSLADWVDEIADMIGPEFRLEEIA